MSGSDPLRLAVLISGTGSNLKSLIEATARGDLNLNICLVISNRPEAPGLDHARGAGIPFAVVDSSNCQAGESEDDAVARRLREASPGLVLLSGYMRIVGAQLVDEFRGRMINQHPSLLPKYKGLHTYRRVLEAGDKEHGASVHFVTAELDGGPVIAQARIPVKPGDTERSLAERLGPVEHRLLQAVMELFQAGRVKMDAGGILFDDVPLPAPLELTDEGTLLT